MTHSAEKGATIAVRLLILQRKCRYPGEHAPEVLSVVDEWTLDENPSWWTAEVAKHKAAQGDDADAWAEVEVEMPLAEIQAALYPTRRVSATTRHIPPDEGGSDGA